MQPMHNASFAFWKKHFSKSSNLINEEILWSIRETELKSQNFKSPKNQKKGIKVLYTSAKENESQNWLSIRKIK